METKELKIEIPKGYEIDKDHSTFECIKPIKKHITYEDVCNTLFKNDTGYFLDQYGEINFYNIETNRFDAPNGRQLKRLLALNKLLNIAEYYNRKTAELNVRYRICYDSIIIKQFLTHLTTLHIVQKHDLIMKKMLYQ